MGGDSDHEKTIRATHENITDTTLADSIIHASLQELVRQGIITETDLLRATTSQIEVYIFRCQYYIAGGTFHDGVFSFNRDPQELKHIPHKLSTSPRELENSTKSPSREEVIHATRDCLATIREQPEYKPPHELFGLFAYGGRFDPAKTPRAPIISASGDIIEEGSDIDTIAIESSPYPSGDIIEDLNAALQVNHPEFRGISFHNRGSYNHKEFRRDLEQGIPPQISWWWTNSPDAAYYVGSLPEITIFLDGNTVTLPSLSEQEINERLQSILHSDLGRQRWQNELLRIKIHIATNVTIQ